MCLCLSICVYLCLCLTAALGVGVLQEESGAGDSIPAVNEATGPGDCRWCDRSGVGIEC